MSVIGKGKSHIGGGYAPNKEKGLELYRRFVEGESDVIHGLAGYNALTGSYSTPDEKAIRDLDAVFTEAKSDMYLYKGFTAFDGDLEVMRKNGTFQNRTYSSTSTSKTTADDYAYRAYDFDEGAYPVRMNIHVKKGTPIADAQKLLGRGGMKSFEKEITVGRNTTWKYSNLKKHTNDDGDEFYTVDVTVGKKGRK